MKITKQRLKEIIKEELGNLQEELNEDPLDRLTGLIEILRDPTSLFRERIDSRVAEDLARELEEIAVTLKEEETSFDF
jgi:tRNA A37 N6-isopentenylltransferase MiaA